MSGALNRMAAAVAGLRDAAQVEELLGELLTPSELRDFALRWELMELLAGGTRQRQIVSELGVSLCKITRGSKILKKKDGVVAKLIEPRSRAAEKCGRKNGNRIARKS